MNIPTHPSPTAEQIQKWLLVLISAAILFAAPKVWNYNPDSGFYIGSALSLLEEGRYWFNGQPNLLYYPGTSALLTVPIALFGLNFHSMHILFALLAVVALWLARACFPVQRYGWIGVLLPVLLGTNQLFNSNAQLVMSDVAFLNLVLLALYLWRRFDITGDQRWFAACALVVAVSPMFRFQGLLLVGAFGLTVLAHVFHNRGAGWAFAFRLLGTAALTLLPFALWTLRNYQLHTADTYNMANAAFFGLSGLKISGQGFGVADWIDADWKIPVYQIMYLFGGLGNSFLGELDKYVPLELVTAVVLVLIVAGGWSWLRQASIFEAAFVFTAGAMHVNQFIGGQSLYIVDRYWLPLLPFFIVIAGLGIRQVGETLAGIGLRPVINTGAGALVFVLLVSGAASWADRLSTKRAEQLATEYDAVMAVADYVQNHVPPDTVILTTDWGVAPLLTGRRSYPVLRSSCDRPTLEIIRDKMPGYLVIMPSLLRTNMALAMTERYPQAFHAVFRTAGREPEPFGAVYAIDPEHVPSLIANMKCPWEK